MTKRAEPTEPKAPPIEAFSLIRADGMWRLLYLDIPAEDVALYETKRSAPDLLAMLVSRVENELHRLPERG